MANLPAYHRFLEALYFRLREMNEPGLRSLCPQANPPFIRGMEQYAIRLPGDSSPNLDVVFHRQAYHPGEGDAEVKCLTIEIAPWQFPIGIQTTLNESPLLQQSRHPNHRGLLYVDTIAARRGERVPEVLLVRQEELIRWSLDTLRAILRLIS